MPRPSRYLTTPIVAALAVAALAIAILAGGGMPAQATTATLAPDGSGGGNLSPLPQGTGTPTLTETPAPTPTPMPRFPEPEPCADPPAQVVSSGHVALFDVYWDPDEKELALNPCPPDAVHIPAEYDDADELVTLARNVRTSSGISIAETVIHIPNSARIDLNASATYTTDDYREVWVADDKENRDTDDDGDGDGVGDGVVWALPACPDGALPGSLCLGFSAELLNPEDWGTPNDEASGGGNVQFRLIHTHQHDVGEQGGRYVLAYRSPDADAGAAPKLIWDTSDADQNVMEVVSGGSEHPTWFFTSAGRYEFQVYADGYPEVDRTGGLEPVSADPSVSSDVREYFVHVGLLADLSVTTTVTPESPAPGDDVTITVTASNAGPDTATAARVDVALPAGLTYSAHSAATGTTYDAGVWTVGDLAVTDEENEATDDDSPTLTITATVAEGTRGQEQTVTADIYATEHLGSVDVLELDPWTGDNSAAATVTPVAATNVNPMFTVARSVTENADPGTLVGAPVAVRDPNSGDTLTFGLTGDDAEHFAVAADANGDAQITVAAGAAIDYETRRSYALVLTVSDGLDRAGNADPSVDHTLGVSIKVEDVAEPFTASLTVDNATPTVGDDVTFTITVANVPAALVDDLHYTWTEHDQGGGNSDTQAGAGIPSTFQPIFAPTEPVVREYQISFWTSHNQQRHDEAYSNTVTVTWAAQ